MRMPLRYPARATHRDAGSHDLDWMAESMAIPPAPDTVPMSGAPVTELHESRAERVAVEVPTPRHQPSTQGPPSGYDGGGYRPEPATGVIDLALERRDERTGALVRRAIVTDLADTSPTRARRQAQIAARDQLLRSHPEWAGVSVEDDGSVLRGNEVAEWLYESSPALQDWRGRLVPSAQALFPLQRPYATHLPTGTPIDDKARGFFLDSLDGVAVRTRAAVLRDVVARTSARWSAQGHPVGSTWVSLACGGALPVLDSLSALAPHVLDLVLVDIDPEALDFASGLVRQSGLTQEVTYLKRDLVRTVVVRDSLVQELGAGSAAVVDALGIFEYFNDAACVRMLRNAHRLVADGGVLVVANMLADRPELAWNKRGIGWPNLYERSLERLLELVALAGIDTARTTVTIPQDGVYAVVSIDC